MLSPNPLSSEARLSFVTTRPGPARVEIFDVQGRIMRKLIDAARLSPGRHAVAIDRGRGDARLDSGIYFYRLRVADGERIGKFAVLEK
jgi:hypothetical protein